MRNLALVWVLAGVAVVLLAAGDGKPPVSTYTDKRDGKVYKIVKIGRQVWFAENLNYAAEGSGCYRNSEDDCAKYGRLYGWPAALKACPVGWHLSTNKEWDTLVDYIGGRRTAGTKLKSTSGWNDYKEKSGNGTDEYGFSALPGGNGFSGFVFSKTGGNIGYRGFWWSATEGDAGNPGNRKMEYYDGYVGRSPDYRDKIRYRRNIYMDRGEGPSELDKQFEDRMHEYEDLIKASLFSVRCVAD